MRGWVARAGFALVVLTLALAARPLAALGEGGWAGPLPNLLAGAGAVALALLAERLLLTAPPDAVAGGVAGMLAGGLAGLLIGTALGGVAPGVGSLALAISLFVGASAGVRIAVALRGSGHAARPFSAEVGPGSTQYKIVDTSVVIDGRISDVCETGFLDGVLVIPGFVLRELQSIADSTDPLRRARGRRGLEVLERLKRSGRVKVRFPQEDLPEVQEVDQKLVELARRTGGKLLTQDLNLNKVAGLHGVEVLNLNDLANALKPVVLPGERLRVSIVKEGKEPEQGVAYLDDGTMVVVDQARRLIGRTLDVQITSVLQTTAGKLFFARIPVVENGADRPGPSVPSIEGG
jgi:rRNA-processing protein FCF1